MKKSQSTSTRNSGDAKKTIGFFEALKQHQSDLRRSIFQLKTKNDQFVREQYNYMDKLFEQSASPDLIKHQQSLYLSADKNQKQVFIGNNVYIFFFLK